MTATSYKVMTPHGGFEAQWAEDEETPVQYVGNEDAIAFFKAFLDLNSISGPGGALVKFEFLEPADLYGFCQSAEYGITVLPTKDDIQESIEEEDMDMTPVMDAVDDSQAFALIGEGAQILKGLDESADSFFTDLGRLREIVLALGSDAGTEDKVKKIDAAYRFANATQEFKEWLVEAVEDSAYPDKAFQLDQPYSPLATAAAMEEAAKRHGASIEWGFFGGRSMDSIMVLDSIDEDGWVGNIVKDGGVVGRIDMGPDGKAMVYVGPTGSRRVQYEGRDAYYSDDDAPLMIDWLFNDPNNAAAMAGKKEPELDYQAKAVEMLAAMDENERAAVRFGMFPAEKMRAAEAEGYTDSHRLSVALMDAKVPEAEPAKPAGISSEDARKVANTIYQQLGGSRFKAMTGAKSLLSLSGSTAPNGGLQITLPSNFAKDGINKVIIKLNSSDTYDVEFGKARGTSYKVITTSEGIYADSLAEVFTRYTGLDTSLGSMGRKEPNTADSQPEPFEHSGFKIYPHSVNVGGEVKAMWGVQSIENRERAQRGERQLGGDGLFDTKEQAMAEAERQVKRMESDAAWAKEQAENEKAAAEAEAARLAMFADFIAYKGYSPPSAEKARQALLKPVRWKGVDTTIKALVEELVAEGRFIGDDDGKRGLEHADGRWMEEKTIGKTGMDYAEYLISKRAAPSRPSAAEDTEMNEATTFLQSVIDGKADMMDNELADRLTQIHDKYKEDAAMLALFNEAAKAYSSWMVGAAKKALA